MQEIKVSVQNLYKSYKNNKVLKGVSLKAYAGDIIGIIGSSGSGKSTFLRCINLLEKPNKASIIINNKIIHMFRDRTGYLEVCNKKQLQFLRSKLIMVFQHFNLWNHMTILKNVMEAPMCVLKLKTNEAYERAVYYLTKVGIDKKEYVKYPVNLSGGQQQRVSIARALAMKPEVLLLDEPTSALDPELAKEVLYIIKELAKEGKTMIIVTHEIEFIRYISNYVIFLHQGIIEEEGLSYDILNNPKSLRLQQFLSVIFK